MKKTLLAVITSTLLPFYANADIPFIFSSGEPARASDVNQNFDYLLKMNESITNALDESKENQAPINTLVGTIEEKIVTLESEIDELSNDTEKNKSSISIIDESISTLSLDLNNSKSIAESAQTNALAALSGVNEVTSSVTSLTQTVDTLADELPNFRSGISELETQSSVIANDILTTNSNVQAIAATVENNRALFDAQVIDFQDHNVIFAETTQVIENVREDLEEVKNEVYSIEAGDVCEGDRLANSGKNVADFIHNPVGSAAGDVIQLGTSNITVFSLPYWNDQNSETYTITLPLGEFSVYTNNETSTPCNNAEISDFPSRVRLKTTIDYKLISTEVEATVTSTINAKIKVDYTVFDVSYAVSNTINLGGTAETNTHDMMTYVDDLKAAQDSALVDMLNHITIDAPAD